MKFTKILLATSAIAMSASAFASTGGFYVGLNAGASISKTATKSVIIDYDINFGKQKISKTRAIVEGTLGYDARFDSFVFGADIEFGTAFGKSKKTLRAISDDAWAYCYKPNAGANLIRDVLSDNELENAPEGTIIYYGKIHFADAAVFKTQWRLGIMPRVGYLICPNVETYLTAGIRIFKHKANVQYKTTCVLTSKETKAASSWTENEINSISDADALALAAKPEVTTIPTKKTKVAPVIGFGVKYDINSNIFVKAEYTYMFKTNFAPKGMSKVKYDEHALKLGIGYRF